MEGGGGGDSYGSKFAGADFDVVEFMQRPLTIIRIICLIFAIVVFGCIADGCKNQGHGLCIFNKDDNACNYGIAIGVIAFLACLAFLALDTQFSNFSNAETRKSIVMVDLFFSGVWCFLWFIGFCYLADAWRRAPSTKYTQFQIDHARSAIAFSFFSVITWGGLTVMSLIKYRKGTSEFEGGIPGENHETRSPYASFPTPGERAFQSQPFGGPQQPPVATEYNVPSY